MKIYKESYKRRLQKLRYVNKNRDLINKKSISRLNNCKNSWIDIMPKSINCQICGKSIGFLNKENPICFDHRHEGNELIRNSPNLWLGTHFCTPENIKIWNSCDFGMLCRRCNGFLPTKNRKEFFLLALKYI